MKSAPSGFSHRTEVEHANVRESRNLPGRHLVCGVVLPIGVSGVTFCPELLTESEAWSYLRLDVDGPANPGLTLRYYRERGLLRATRVGRRLRYRRIELERFLERLTETQGAQSQIGNEP